VDSASFFPVTVVTRKFPGLRHSWSYPKKVAHMEQHGLQSVDFAEEFESRALAMRARELRPTAFKSGLAKTLKVVEVPTVDAATLDRFERALEETVATWLVSAGDSPIAEQVRWHFGIGCDDGCRRGKRLRPRLLLQIAFDEGSSFDQAVDAALAVEYLHNYSLVHDDIEDGDELRHGRQAVWARYGVPHGVNAGDSMCALSYLTLLRNSGGLPFDRVAAMARVLHKANLAMCAGQAYDIGFESALHVGMDAYLAMIDGKSAGLFGAACELGALCAGADERRAGAYGELGRAYGRAFQIRDDVLGTWASREETGKPRGTDLSRRKWTFPIVWALAGPPSEHRAAIAARYASAAELDPSDVDAIAEALEALGARRAAEEACEQLVREADRIADAYRMDRYGKIRELFEPVRDSIAIA
jgi:geranylgeranyl diphosphate synthase type I